MPPPDNTPPVMTPTDKTPVLTRAHLAEIRKELAAAVKLRDHFKGERGGFDSERNYLREVRESAVLLRDIESVVRTIVESGGTLRLAGEDEVIVKRKWMGCLGRCD